MASTGSLPGLPALPQHAKLRNSTGIKPFTDALRCIPAKTISLKWSNGNQLRGHVTLQNTLLAESLSMAFQFVWRSDSVFVYPATGVLLPGQKIKVIRM